MPHGRRGSRAGAEGEVTGPPPPEGPLSPFLTPNARLAHTKSQAIRWNTADRLAFRGMGLGRLELPTSRLSGVRSNHLSYRPG